MTQTDPVEDLLARCLERPEAEWLDALRATCEAHPEVADELLARWELLRGLGVTSVDDGDADEEPFPERLGDFRLLRRLGAGGMGVVYVAEQVSLGRRVALKLIRPEHLYFPGARARFRREVEAAARLQHRGIVPVHVVGEERGIPYFAMEWVQGCTLADLLQELSRRGPEELTGGDLATALARATEAASGEPVPVDRSAPAFQGSWVAVCLRLVRDVAAALRHAHERGVLHRDVKTSNILIGLDGVAMLVDFGLASSGEAAPITKTGAEIGSLPSMAPERLRGVLDDERSDVYSLGVVLYELLTLRRPFLARTADEVRRRILEDEPALVRSLNSAVEWDQETVCHVAMERDLERRYASVADFEADLANLEERRSIVARRPGPILRVRRWVQRHPVRSVILLCVAMLLWGGPLLWWRLERTHRAEVEARLEERNRLKDHKVLRDLLDQERALHPAGPQIERALATWLATATELEERRSIHEATRARLEQELHAGTASDPGAWEWEIDTLAAVLEMLDRVAEVRPDLEDRHDFATTVVERTIESDEAVDLWDEAIFEIEESDRYDGLVLMPQIGLLPLEPDPETGLWEFWHVRSGARPERDPDTDRWRIEPGMGLVFVLIPAGAFLMGCEPPGEHAVGEPNVDAMSNSTGIEGPVHEVTLEPFFLSRYEMTQAQWLRFTGANPSVYPPERETGAQVIDATHPVEGMTWLDADRVIRNLGLALPTESQWEYAARSGTDTVFHFGDDGADMTEFGNVLDLRWKKQGHERAEDFEDAFYFHAPVGSFEPNDFGLHDVHGNVYEWCQDRWSAYGVRPARPGDGLRENPFGSAQRVARGGSWEDGNQWARSAARNFHYEDSGDQDVGVRPMRPLDPEADPSDE